MLAQSPEARQLIATHPGMSYEQLARAKGREMGVDVDALASKLMEAANGR